MTAGLKRHSGVAGNFAVSGGGLTFHGSVYGAPGPVVMATPGGAQMFVTQPGRFGERFDEKWVERFLDEARSASEEV